MAKVMVRVPPVEVKVPTLAVAIRTLEPSAFTPVVPLPVHPKTSDPSAPPFREIVRVAPPQLPVCEAR